ncbi:uncharacterized protein DEA37_0004277 [Paragonimus westermani]|uniref:Uncharacterized protein n=1 Tax=Paragonimus westermani TaxID=34504 RepID=A0A5J4NQ75_9TREM|nr:uncharacterized protein DEA37_0004277 [Paragonimus westermani]
MPKICGSMPNMFKSSILFVPSYNPCSSQRACWAALFHLLVSFSISAVTYVFRKTHKQLKVAKLFFLVCQRITCHLITFSTRRWVHLGC